MMLFLRTAPPQFAQVDLIGGEDEIEVVEIRCVHLAGAEGRQVIPAVSRVSHRARIWCVADVIILRPGGIELDAQAGLPGLDAQDFLRRR